MISIFQSPIALAFIHWAWGRHNPALPWLVGHTAQTPAHIRLASVARLARAVARALQDQDWAPGLVCVQTPPTEWVEWAARHWRSLCSAMVLPPGVDVQLPGTLRRHPGHGGGYGGRILGHLASVVLDARWRPHVVAADAEAALCHASAIEALVEAADQDITDWTPVVQSLVRRGNMSLSDEAMKYYGLVEALSTAAAVEAAVLEAAELLGDIDRPIVGTRRVQCTELAYTPVDLSGLGVDRDGALGALSLYESPVLGGTWSPLQEYFGYTYIDVRPEKGDVPWSRIYVGYGEGMPYLYVGRPIRGQGVR